MRLYAAKLVGHLGHKVKVDALSLYGLTLHIMFCEQCTEILLIEVEEPQ